MEKKVELGEQSLKFAEAFLHLSKTNHKFSLFILYKYFRSKRTKEKFDILLYLLHSKNTNLYLKVGVKAVLKTSWKKMTREGLGLGNPILRTSNSSLVSDGIHFSGEINRKKTLRIEANNWWDENKPSTI